MNIRQSLQTHIVCIGILECRIGASIIREDRLIAFCHGDGVAFVYLMCRRKLIEYSSFSAPNKRVMYMNWELGIASTRRYFWACKVPCRSAGLFREESTSRFLPSRICYVTGDMLHSHRQKGEGPVASCSNLGCGEHIIYTERVKQEL
jgi:hypothetical protein